MQSLYELVPWRRSQIFHISHKSHWRCFLDISLSSREANSLACSCVRVCVSLRQNRAWCANQNHLPLELCFANLLLTDLTFDLPRARFKQGMNGLCVNVSVCVELFHSCSFGGKIDPSVPDFRETPLMERFCSAYAPVQSFAQNVAFTLEKSLWNAVDQLKRIVSQKNFILYVIYLSLCVCMNGFYFSDCPFG